MKPFIVTNEQGFAIAFILPDQVAGAYVDGSALFVNLKAGGATRLSFSTDHAALYAMSVLVGLIEEEAPEQIKVNQKGQRLNYEAVCQGDSRCGWSLEIPHRISAPEKCPDCGGSVGTYSRVASPVSEEKEDKTIRCLTCTETFAIGHYEEIPTSCPACGQGPIQLLDTDDPPEN